MNADFRRLWAAQATSAFGSRLTRTALPIIAILTIDASPMEIGVLGALAIGPGALLGLLAGGVIDRSQKRAILIGADLVRLVLLLSIPLVAHFGSLTMAQLFVVAALVGAATTLFQIADNTYLPALVRRDQLIAANARLETTEATAEIVGPGLAGVLIELITAPLTILVDAATYAVSALFLRRIETVESIATPEEQPRLGSDLAIGARAVWRHPIIRRLFLAESNVAFWNGFFFALYMLFCLRTLDLSEGAVGLVISVGGVGALLGSLMAGRISRLRRAGPVLLVLLLVNRLGDLFIPMAGLDVGAPLMFGFLVAHQLIADGFRVGYVVLAVSLRQSLLPTEVLGRANAWFQVAENILLLAGILVAGALATAIGINEAVWVGVIGGLSGPLLLVPLLASDQRLQA